MDEHVLGELQFEESDVGDGTTCIAAVVQFALHVVALTDFSKWPLDRAVITRHSDSQNLLDNDFLKPK